MRPRDLSAHAAYKAGRGIEEVARELGLDREELITLSSNENPLGPSPDAQAAIHEAADSVHLYPKAAHTDLLVAIARQWGVAPAQVWLANGGDGAVDYLARALLDPGDEVLVANPGFAYYAMSARYHHGRVNEFPLSKAEEFAQDSKTVLERYDGERIVYLTRPHNPTGSEISLEGVETIADGTAENTLVLVDEAYGEFTDVPSTVRLLEGREGHADHADDGDEDGTASTDTDADPVDGKKREKEGGRDDVAVLRTFSKAHGLAGLRLGYALVPASWADAYARVNTPFAANLLACRAGLAAIEDDDHVERSVETARWARGYIREHVEARTWPSGGNFVLCDVGDATRVTNALAERGVIARDCSSFGLPECIRITCGTREGTRRAVSTVNEVLEGI